MDKRIREGIEACRPGVDDLLDSELAGLLELADAARAVSEDPDARRLRDRVQKWDAAISASMEQVPVPVDLAQRILSRLQDAETAAGSATTSSGSLLSGAVNDAIQEQPLAEGGIEVIKPSLWQRRHWAGASLSAIAAAALVIAAGYWLQWGSDLPLEQLAQDWHTELTNEWQSAELAPSGYPVPDAIRVPPTRYQWINRLTPTPVVAYELMLGKTKAMLYAARMKRPGLRGTPPPAPQWDTAGEVIGYWQSGDIVYVLVVPDVRSYRAFVRSSSAPLAFVRPPHHRLDAVLVRRNSSATRKIA
jgi:hypothetical protein